MVYWFGNLLAGAVWETISLPVGTHLCPWCGANFSHYDGPLWANEIAHFARRRNPGPTPRNPTPIKLNGAQMLAGKVSQPTSIWASLLVCIDLMTLWGLFDSTNKRKTTRPIPPRVGVSKSCLHFVGLLFWHSLSTVSDEMWQRTRPLCLQLAKLILW